MFGLGFWEILMIALVIIVFVPPKDMPKVFSRIGKVYGEIRSFNRSVRNTMRTLELDVDREYRAARRKERENAGSGGKEAAGGTEAAGGAESSGEVEAAGGAESSDSTETADAADTQEKPQSSTEHAHKES